MKFKFKFLDVLKNKRNETLIISQLKYCSTAIMLFFPFDRLEKHILRITGNRQAEQWLCKKAVERKA